MGKVRRSAPAAERFARKLERAENGCLLWTGAVGSHGYGNFWGGERDILAHRFAYQEAHGVVLERGRRGPVVMQTCDRPLCCEPEHLQLGTHATNHADCRAKDRGPQFRRKLSEEQAREALRRWRAGETQEALGRAFGVDQTTISAAIRRVAA